MTSGKTPTTKGLGIKTKLLWENPQYREHMSKAHMGQVAWNKGKKIQTNTGKTHFKKGNIPPFKGKHLPDEVKKKMSLKLRNRAMLKTRGPLNWNWKGGTSRTEDKKIRQSIEYKIWRRAVFERDKHTCIWCGIRGGKLHADHIKPFALFPALRFAIDNGRTLCIPCHLKTDTYGGKTK